MHLNIEADGSSEVQGILVIGISLEGGQERGFLHSSHVLRSQKH